MVCFLRRTNVDVIGEYCFSECKSLTSVTFAWRSQSAPVRVRSDCGDRRQRFARNANRERRE
jgi:hypothetical protein